MSWQRMKASMPCSLRQSCSARTRTAYAGLHLSPKSLKDLVFQLPER